MNQSIAVSKLQTQQQSPNPPVHEPEGQLTSSAEPSGSAAQRQVHYPQLPSSAEPVLSPTQRAEGEEDTWQAHDNGSDDEDDDFQTMTFPERIAEQVVESTTRNRAESNKENEMQDMLGESRTRRGRIFDSQPNAVREEWHGGFDDDDEPEVLQDVTERQNRQQSSASNSIRERRRRRSPDEDDENPSPPRRPRTQENPRRTQDRDAPSKEPPPPTQADVHREANEAARERVAMQPKKVQTRTPWSAEETSVFIDLVNEYGPKYALLQKMDKNSVLHHRDQVALKDKAQNVKMDFLKYACDLGIVASWLTFS